MSGADVFLLCACAYVAGIMSGCFSVAWLTRE